ncbi:hypothetical protein WA026_019119 [Henosepilachna vigintioctopunctata]|uniref:Peptidase S1 domain-containing protein n=1 Tax=Henosepilachna vigintioctopunctata TaxID=420089 RepID=A0AAW1VC85_9CUCU
MNRSEEVEKGAETPYAQVYKIQNFIVHPQFEPTTQQNDIALVKTVKAITFSMYVGPICLPFRYTSIDLTGLPVIALGWGSDDFSSPRSQVLQEVTIDVISNAQCSNTEKYVRDSNICTFTSNKDTCQGDSGGPLAWMATSTRRLQLVGVVSYGLGCATARPSVNARVTSYLSWIISQTPDTNYCIR